MEYIIIVILIVLIIVLINVKSALEELKERIRGLLLEVKTLQKIVEQKDTISSSVNPKATSVSVSVDNTIKSTEVKETKPTEVAAEIEKIIAPEPKKVEQPVEKQEEFPQPIYDLPKELSTPTVTNFKPEEKPAVKEVEKKPIIQPKRSSWEVFKEKNPDLEKFVGENLISKIGILILVLGISYFVKYAIDQNWINEPARVGIGVLAGAILLGFAHRLRTDFKAFSSVLVAGAISVFYFTIAIAFHEYHLFSQTVAFIIMVVITIFSCLISISYNRLELAILSMIGGFAVPFMLSTGEGNYVVLFTYLAILNVGILAIGFFKNWKPLKILAFLFTFLIYGAWFFKEYYWYSDMPHFGAWVFALIFYLIFVGISFISQIRDKTAFKPIDLGLLMLNTALFYIFSMLIMYDVDSPLKGLFTVALAAFNLVLAIILNKLLSVDKRSIYLLIGTTVSLVTLAIPIQFKGNFITLFWAVEGVLLFWLGQKAKVKEFKMITTLVHILMLISLVLDWQLYSVQGINLPLLLNKLFITGLVSSLSLFAVYLLGRNDDEVIEKFGVKYKTNQWVIPSLVLGVITLYITGFLELNYQNTAYLGTNQSVSSFLILYHIIFTSIIIVVFKLKEVVGGFLLISNVLAFLYLSKVLVINELVDFNTQSIHTHYAIWVHYPCLLIIIALGFYVFKKRNYYIPKDLVKPLLWIGIFVLVFILSTEADIHGLLCSTVKVNPERYKELAELYQDKKYALTAATRESVEAIIAQISKTVYPILWGIIAFALLITGIRRKVKTVRIIALTLLGITIVKLFTYDIINVSETGKIIAFILLGVLILIISFVYQKIKVLVLDDDEAKKTDEKPQISSDEE